MIAYPDLIAISIVSVVTVASDIWCYSNSSSRLGLASNMASTMATEGLRQASKQIEHLRSQYLDPAMADLGQYR